MTRNQRFRALFQPGTPFVCMGAFDAITAKLTEASGAQAIFVSGFVACGVEAGEPDMGALDAQRTIRLWAEAGASCLHIEDQALPKKCGHFAGKQLVSRQEMVHKLEAMVEAWKTRSRALPPMPPRVPMARTPTPWKASSRCVS